MSAPSTSGLSVELLLRVIDVKYGYFTLLLLYRRNVFCISNHTFEKYHRTSMTRLRTVPTN